MQLPLWMLTEKDLDAAFDAAKQAGDSINAQRYADEIISRLADPQSFLYGLLGADEFPLYAKWTGFSQSNAAQTSATDSAGKVGGVILSGAQTAAKAVGGVAWTALAPVAVAAGLIALAAYLVKRKGEKNV